MPTTYGSSISYVASDPTVSPTAGQPSLVQNINTGEMWYYNAYSTLWENFTASEVTCPINSVTKAEFDALVFANTLIPGCRYTISNYTQGNLIGAELIVTATSNSTISRAVDVRSTFTPNPWKGVYDYLNDILITLEDHQGNVIIDTTGVSIGLFPWGNGNYTNNLVVNSTLTTTAAPIIVNALVLLNSSVLNLSNMTGGGINNVIITNESTVNCTGANVSITGSTITNKSILNYSNNIAVNSCDSSLFDQSYLDVSTSNIPTTITGSSFTAASTVLVLNVVSSGLSIVNCTFNKGVFSKSGSGTGAVTLLDTTLTTDSQISNTSAGVVNISTSRIAGQSSINQGSSGLLEVYKCDLNNLSEIRTLQARGLQVINTTLNNNSFIESNGLSSVSDIVTACTILNGAHIWFNSTSALAPNKVTNTTVDGLNAFISFSTGTFGQEILYSSVSNSYINITNAQAASVHTYLNLMTNSTYSITDITAKRDTTNLVMHNSSSLSVSDCSTIGTIGAINLTNESIVLVLGTTVNIDNLEVSNATVTLSSTNTSKVVIRNSSYFQDGGFTLVDVVYFSPAAFTCTANNNGRATYLGLTSSLPVL